MGNNGATVSRTKDDSIKHNLTVAVRCGVNPTGTEHRIWNTAAGTATSYGLDDPEFESAKRQARLSDPLNLRSNGYRVFYQCNQAPVCLRGMHTCPTLSFSTRTQFHEDHIQRLKKD